MHERPDRKRGNHPRKKPFHHWFGHARQQQQTERDAGGGRADEPRGAPHPDVTPVPRQDEQGDGNRDEHRHRSGRVHRHDEGEERDRDQRFTETERRPHERGDEEHRRDLQRQEQRAGQCRLCYRSSFRQHESNPHTLIPPAREENAMANAVRPIPEGYHSLTPYLVVDGAAKAIEFYKQAFGAVELYHMDSEGRIGHAELQIGDSRFMLADEFPERGIRAPEPGRPGGDSLLLYVDNVDAVVDRAVAAGATLERKVENQFYGDRSGGIIDPFGHRWYVATHVEDVA